MSDGPLVRIARAHEAEVALKVLVPILDAMIAECTRRQREISRSRPYSEAISNVAIAANIIEDCRAEIQSRVDDGKVAQGEADWLRKIEEMSPTQRRYADALGPAQ